MIVLLVCGQDIRSLSLGLVRDGALAADTTMVAAPERYLARVAEMLAEWKVSLEELDAVAVVTGPGSFTSSRVSTTIANGIAFAKGIPVLAIENADRLNLHELAARTDFAALPPADRYAVPAYDRPPHITTPLTTKS